MISTNGSYSSKSAGYYSHPTIHLKDMAISGRERKMAPIGEGNLNWPAIFAAFEKAGTKYMLVEQDTCEGSPFAALKSSYDFLAKSGYC